MRTNQPIDREALYEEVWAEPITVVAKRYGLSDVGLIKKCGRMKIPVPRRGYWAKVRAGQRPRKAQLPELDPEAWVPSGPARLTDSELAARDQVTAELARAKEVLADPERTNDAGAPHPLVSAAGRCLRKKSGWTDPKGIRAAPNDVIDIRATEHAIDRALAIVDSLLNLLGAMGISISVDPVKGATTLDGRGVCIPFVLTERINRSRHVLTDSEVRARDRYYKSWRSNLHIPMPDIPEFDWTPTGQLTISVGKYPVSRSWNDTDKTPLEKRLAKVAIGIVQVAEATRAHEDAERDRLQQLQDAKVRYESAVARRADEASRFSALTRCASRYRRAQSLRTYIDAFEASAIARDELDANSREWIAWARAKADWVDPLIDVSDPILDAPKPVRPYTY